MSSFLAALIIGVGFGGFYALLGSGVVAAFKGSGVINFSHAAIAMYSAYTFNELRGGLAASSLDGDVPEATLVLPWIDFIPGDTINIPVKIGLGSAWPAFPAIILTLLVAAGLGLMMHFLVFRPLRNSPALGKVIGSVGVMIYLQAVAQLNFGSVNRRDEGVVPTSTAKNFLGLGADIGVDNFIIAGIALAVGAGLTALYQFTRFGIATRAADENEKGAVLLGYSAQRLAGINWVLSAFAAGIAAVFFIQAPSLNQEQWSLFIVPALGAALIGNLSSIWMTTLGGLGLGMLQNGLTDVAERQAWWSESFLGDLLPSAAVREVLPLIAVITVLFLRGDKLPVRGSVVERRQPRAPKPSNPVKSAILPTFMALIAINVFTGSWESNLTATLVAAIFMLSFVVVVGYLGQISLAQLTFGGVAAYAAIRFFSNGEKIRPFDLFAMEGLDLPSPIAFVLGVAVAVVAGVIVGLPAVRVRGVQLAVVTITAVLAFEQLHFQNAYWTQDGARSNTSIEFPNWFGADVSIQPIEGGATDRWQFSVFLLIWVVALAIGVANLRRGATGRRFLAVRANERAAAAAGINVARTKLLGFGIGAGIAGIGGILLSYKLTSISPDSWNVFAGLALLAFAYLGGISSVSGAMVGSLLVAGGLVDALTSLHLDSLNPEYFTLIGGVGLILTAILNPEGIAAGNFELWSHVIKPRLQGLVPAAVPASTSTPTPATELELELDHA
jgi:ABC-type branched-subunit amino acid transport system permease subunit